MLLPHEPHAARANSLLASLPVENAAYLASATRLERPVQGQVLSSRSEPVHEVWFPLTGVIALSATDNESRSVQSGLVGPEGCVGLETLFRRMPALADAAVQVAGDMAVIPAAHLRSGLESRPAIQVALSRFLFELTSQALQTVACNRLHSLDSRCCRWLLMLQDRTSDDDLPLTQESLATMLGSGRPRINGLLASFEQDGLVQRYRGRIRLLTREGLKRRACECYRLIQYKPRR